MVKPQRLWCVSEIVLRSTRQRNKHEEGGQRGLLMLECELSACGQGASEEGQEGPMRLGAGQARLPSGHFLPKKELIAFMFLVSTFCKALQPLGKEGLRRRLLAGYSPPPPKKLNAWAVEFCNAHTSSMDVGQYQLGKENLSRWMQSTLF